MIVPLQEKHLNDIATTHLLAWQEAFKGILSDDLLYTLTQQEFLGTWRQVVQDVRRKNYVALSEKGFAIGFVSFGPAKENKQWAEIYGIYVHPDHWEQGYGRELMSKAVSEIKSSKKYSGIILWVMSGNYPARDFYERVGFRPDDATRTSERKGEEFEECRYSMEL